MPLIFVTVFFALLFCGEGIWFDACRNEEAAALARYELAEHPRRQTGDKYIDLFG